MPHVTHNYLIIVPQYGRHELTLSCLSSLLRHGVPHDRIMVVDNGSDLQDQRETACSLSAGMKLIQESRRGITHAWNHGWRESHCDYVIFLNNDTVASGDFIPTLLAPFENPQVDIVGLKRGDDRELRLLQAKKIFPGNEYPRLIQGWCFAVRRCSLVKLHGFDAELEMYFSDTDLCLRVQRDSKIRKHSIEWIPELPIKHLAHQTLKNAENKRLLWQRDRDLFLTKWSINHAAGAANL